MHILSALDAISPAVTRTRDLLFRPFRWGTFLKLCAVAVITERLVGRSRFWNAGGRGGGQLQGGPVFTSLSPQLVALIVLACIAGLIIGLVVFYLVTRLRFALFDCLSQQTTEIRPGWHIYRQPANRFYFLSLGVLFGFLVVAASVLSPFLLGILHRLREAPGHPIAFPQILEYLLPMIPVLVCLALLGVAADIVLRDFMLPHIALDNATAGQALQAVWDHIAAEKGAFFLYAVLRIVLPIVALVALAIALLIPGVIFFGGGGILIALLKAAEMHGPAGAILWTRLLEVVLIVAMAGLGIFLAIIFGGPLSIAVRNYALLFYGGRYKTLGDTLYPPNPAGPGLPA